MCLYLTSREGPLQSVEVLEVIKIFSSGKSIVDFFCRFKPKRGLRTVDILYPNKNIEEVINISRFRIPSITGQVRKFVVKEPFKDAKPYREILENIGSTGFKFYTLVFKETIKKGTPVSFALRFISPKACRTIESVTKKEIDFTVSGPMNVRRAFEIGMEAIKIQLGAPDVPIGLIDHAFEGVNEVINRGFRHRVNLNTYSLLLIFEPRILGLSPNAENLTRVDTLRTRTFEWPYGRRIFGKKGKEAELHQFVYNNNGRHINKANFRVGGSGSYEKKLIVYLPLFLATLALLLAIFMRIL